jgi:hypothetical protein
LLFPGLESSGTRPPGSRAGCASEASTGFVELLHAEIVEPVTDNRPDEFQIRIVAIPVQVDTMKKKTFLIASCSRSWLPAPCKCRHKNAADGGGSRHGPRRVGQAWSGVMNASSRRTRSGTRAEEARYLLRRSRNYRRWRRLARKKDGKKTGSFTCLYRPI